MLFLALLYYTTNFTEKHAFEEKITNLFRLVSFLLSALRNDLRSADHNCLKAYLEYSTDLKSIITKLNERIIKNTTEDRFITFFFGLYNANDHTLTYINAGHNPPILVLENEELQRLEKGGIFIGCLPWEYELETIQLPNHSILALFTDGIVEAMNDKQEEFGEDQLISVLKGDKSLTMDELREQIIKRVKEHRGGNILEDDLTLALFKRVG